MGKWKVCERCLTKTISEEGVRRKMAQECPGASPNIAMALAAQAKLDEERKRKLVLFDAKGLPGMVCLSCGAFTTTLVTNSNLSYSCIPKKGATRRAGKLSKGEQNLRRFRRGRHPDERQKETKIAATWRVDGEGGFAPEWSDDGGHERPEEGCRGCGIPLQP